jgi:hypothetical protein
MKTRSIVRFVGLLGLVVIWPAFVACESSSPPATVATTPAAQPPAAVAPTSARTSPSVADVPAPRPPPASTEAPAPTPTPTPTATVAASRPPPAGRCGDGICEGPENPDRCPGDCQGAPAAATAAPAPTATPTPTATPRPAAPFFLTTATHMEGDWNDDTDRDLFFRHADRVRFIMDLADEFGALVTIESEKPFARGNTLWGLNIMREVLDRGHGVGTHCDIGGGPTRRSPEQYAELFRENKELVDALVGAANNRGCSGGGGANDWARAASLAGFDYLDGIVSRHMLSMPMAARPGATWTDFYIVNGHGHVNAPIDLYERIYPFMVVDARDFVPDADGLLLVSSGEIGDLAGMTERAYEEGGTTCTPDCDFQRDDVDTLVGLIEEIDRNRDRDRVAKLTVYLPLSLFDSDDEATLRYFFEQMADLAERGLVTWGTQLDVYAAFVARAAG